MEGESGMSHSVGTSPTIGRWRTTWRGLRVAQADDALYQDLVTRYSERGRSYHTHGHEARRRARCRR